MLKNRLLFAFFICFILVLNPFKSYSDNFELDPRLLVYGGYDDNILYNRTGVIKDFFAAARPELGVIYSSERNMINLDTYIEAIRYSEESDLDTENYRIELSGDLRLSDRSDLFFEAFHLKDTTVDSQLEETGRIVEREDRRQNRGNFVYGYKIDEVSDFGLEYRYRSVEYQSDSEIDRTEHRFRVPYYRWFNERLDRFSIRPSYARSQLENDTTVDAYNLSVGWVHIFSETLRMENYIGYSYTVESNENEDNKYQSGSADLKIIKNSDIYSILAGFRTYVSLNPAGDLDEVDRLYCKFSKELTERLSLNLDGGLYITRPLEIYDEYETAYYEIKTAISYQLKNNHSIGIGYTYQNEYDRTISEDRDRIRNLIWISVQ